MSPGPLPAHWRRIIERSVPPPDRAHVLREVEALYAVRLEREGPEAARRWLLREALGYAAMVPIERARLGLRRGLGNTVRNGMIDLMKDVARALRSFRRTPGFALLAVATLTLGIGANTVVFSVVDHVALRSLPFEDPDALVSIWPSGLLGGELAAIREETRSFEAVAGYRVGEGYNLELGDGALRVGGVEGTAELLPLLGVTPAVGRSFAREEDDPGAEPVVLLSHALWRDAFGGADVVGRRVGLEGVQRTVVGVLPAGFAFPERTPDVLVPMVLDPADPGTLWGSGGWHAVGRLLPGVQATAAEAELATLAPILRERNPLWTPVPEFHQGKHVVPLGEALVGDVRPALLVLLGAVGLVLLVACANVANLLLARGLGRARELAVRVALGASRVRLVREQLVESLLLAALGLAAALVAARWALDGVLAVLPADLPRAEGIRLDARVVVVGSILALLAGVIAGLVPALRGSRLEPGAALREGRRAGTGVRRRRLALALVTTQVAVAALLVTGAALLTRSLSRMMALEPGFDTDLVVADVTLAGPDYQLAGASTAFFERVAERLSAGGGGRAAVASRAPFDDAVEGVATFIEGVTDDSNSLPVFSRARVLPGYFETLGIPVLEGRALRASDDAGGRLVAVVDRVAAERFWPGESPVGRRIRYPWASAPWIEIVGVVAPVADGAPGAEPLPAFYQPLAQQPASAATVLARGAVAADVRRAVQEIDERVPVSAVGTMEARVGSVTADTRWITLLLGLFAAATLLSGCVGVYGVVAYTVRERTRDLGVRLALGASRERIRARVLRDGLIMAAPGALLGLALAVPAGRLLEGHLFEVSRLDPLTFVGVPLLMALAALAAVYVPARRATSVDPIETLRGEGS